MEMHERVVNVTALFFFLPQMLTVGKALIAAENKDGRQENTEEQVFFRQEQSNKNSDADPEHDKTDGFLHSRPPSFIFALLHFYFLFYAAGKKHVTIYLYKNTAE